MQQHHDDDDPDAWSGVVARWTLQSCVRDSELVATAENIPGI